MRNSLSEMGEENALTVSWEIKQCISHMVDYHESHSLTGEQFSQEEASRICKKSKRLTRHLGTYEGIDGE